jgi:hypothetical protein
MNLGIRALLLLVAVVLFVIAVFSDDPSDLIAVGLACTAGAFLAGELGITGRIGARR